MAKVYILCNCGLSIEISYGHELGQYRYYVQRHDIRVKSE